MKKETWSSQLGVILAVAGSAIGLGNYLRFPGLAAIYGGVSFMIPYFISFLIIGLPLAWAEWALGRYGGQQGFHSVPGVLQSITGKRWTAYVGSIGIVISVLIFMYYVLIESWCLVYAVKYLFGTMNLGDSEHFKAYFDQLIGIEADGAVFAGGFFDWRLGVFVFCFFANFYLIYRGISRGIEVLCLWAMPLLLLLSLVVLARVLTLGNPTGLEGQSVQDGLAYVWNPVRPDQTVWSALANPEAWLAAAGHMFFSLSLGMGAIMTYTSYMKKNDDIALSCLTASSANGFCEVVLASMMVVPAAVMFLGPQFMTHENLNSPFTIGFLALPQVFNQMPLGQMFGCFFFVLLFLGAITSSVSILQPQLAFMEEAFVISRSVSVSILAVVNLLGAAFITYFSKGLTALDTIDFWVANIFLFLGAGFQVFIFAWMLGIDKGMDELRRGAKIRIPEFVKIVIKYIAPAYLTIIFLTWTWKYLPERLHQICTDATVQISLGFILVIALTVWGVTAHAVRKWKGK